MRKQAVLAAFILLAATGVAATSASAQKIHAPKQVWQAMVAGLSDIQSMTAALMVFDMTSIEATANELAAREDFISKIDELPDAVKEGHAQVARAAESVTLAAAAGEEQDVSSALAEVTAACSSCHYDLRDKKRREKME